MYPSHNQEDPNNPLMTEASAYPANPDSEYGWEKLFSERLYMTYARNYGIEVRIARFHNIFGPLGSWNNGKEKEEELLASCYYNCLLVAKENDIRSIAFPSISTGEYAFPVELAAKIAVKTVNRFLSENPDSIDVVIWVLFDECTEKVYEKEVDKLY